MASDGHSLMQLQEITGIPKRTLRDWVQRGILPRPVGKGRAVRYTTEHAQLATAIRHIVRQDGVTLTAARARADQLTAAQRDAISDTPTISEGGSTQRSSPTMPSYPFTSWELVSLADGLVLMVDPSRGPLIRHVAGEIYRHFAASPQPAGIMR